MQQTFDQPRNVYIDRVAEDDVVALRHLDAPVRLSARTPQAAAAEYLHQFGDLLLVPDEALAHLDASPSRQVEDAPVELRFDRESAQFDATTVAYQQTALGLPVVGAGVAVHLIDGRALSSTSTTHPKVEVEPPDPDDVARALDLGAATLATQLGVGPGARDQHPEARIDLRIDDRRLVVLRYDPAARQRDEAPRQRGLEPTEAVRGPRSQLLLPLPPVPKDIAPGAHRVCVEVDFRLTVPTWGELNWTAILDVATLAVLQVRAHVDEVTGLVFDVDPMTSSGGPAPSANQATLNMARTSQTLLGLAAPANGSQSLTGTHVTLVDSEVPTIAFPTRPTGSSFDYDSRTDDFAAVNAYVHTDRFFRLAESMGFTHGGYFGLTPFPSSVDHRGRMNTTDGIEVNAHCLGGTGGKGILRTTFALADTGDTTHPIGIAADHRVVLHELAGHGVLYNHVESANFGFAHSAGDSVAAILSDPGSQAADRFLTYPWVAIGRRHDRTPAAGWGWAGSKALNPFDPVLDRGGYDNEQILSSTLFRLYRSIGGDSADLTTRRFAARMCAYLILRAIGTLTKATNPSTAVGFETALETADAGDWVSENITGGAYRKVIRWAFEQQGMFQAAGTTTPNNQAGRPPAVDVYVDDGRAGTYGYQPVFWNTTNVWNRLASDGGTTHQDPVTNRTNYAYVRIRNRGTQTATGVVVKGFHANPAAGLSYPNDWVPMTTTQLSGADVPPNSSGDVVVGPFAWTPRHVGHECMFMIVSAVGDESNVDHIGAGNAIPEWRLVPHDNNIAQRNVAPVPGGTTGLVEEFEHLRFSVHNPMPARAGVQLDVMLPAVLDKRGWRVGFANPGGARFALAAGAAREVVLTLERGEPFGPKDLRGTEDRGITVTARVDGVLVGGMTYELDPTLSHPTRPGAWHHGDRRDRPDRERHEDRHDERHDHHDRHDDRPHGRDGHHDRSDRTDELARRLLEALESHDRRVAGVQIRKVVLEVDVEDCD